MKNYLLIGAMLLIQFSCSNKNSTTSEVGAPSTVANTTEVSPETDYYHSFKKIKKNLDSINATQNRIYFRTKDEVVFAPNLVNEINKEIIRLNALLAENKNTIQNLNSRLKNKSETNKTLSDSIQTLNDLLSENQGDVMYMNDMLMASDRAFNVMEGELFLVIAQNAEQNSKIVKSVADANTVYYIIGTVQELKERQIINTEGGVFGIGERPVINNNLPTGGFTKIDLRDVKMLPLNSMKAKLLTIHSTQSYKLEREKNKVKQLSIINPEEFWRISKYLVIVKES